MNLVETAFMIYPPQGWRQYADALCQAGGLIQGGFMGHAAGCSWEAECSGGGGGPHRAAGACSAALHSSASPGLGAFGLTGGALAGGRCRPWGSEHLGASDNRGFGQGAPGARLDHLVRHGLPDRLHHPRFTPGAGRCERPRRVGVHSGVGINPAGKENSTRRQHTIYCSVQ